MLFRKDLEKKKLKTQIECTKLALAGSADQWLGFSEMANLIEAFFNYMERFDGQEDEKGLKEDS
jgi:hypothetical protein